MLGWRILISVILIPSLLLLFYYDASVGDHALPLLLFSLLLTVRASFELTELLKARSMKPSYGVTASACVLVVMAGWVHARNDVTAGLSQLLTSLGWIGAAMTAAFLVLLTWEAVRFSKPGAAMESLGANTVTVVYAGLLLAVTAQFRWFPSSELGYFAIGSAIIAAKSGDIGGYTIGRIFGKRKMAPKLSPGKTWAGAMGAVLGSCLGGGLWLTFGGRLFDAAPKVAELTNVIAYCATIGVVGLLGDLCESLIKRDVEKKDSAVLMPGFGGLLDLLDSILFAAPIALLWWVLWPPAS